MDFPGISSSTIRFSGKVFKILRRDLPIRQLEIQQEELMPVKPLKKHQSIVPPIPPSVSVQNQNTPCEVWAFTHSLKTSNCYEWLPMVVLLGHPWSSIIFQSISFITWARWWKLKILLRIWYSRVVAGRCIVWTWWYEEQISKLNTQCENEDFQVLCLKYTPAINANWGKFTFTRQTQ